MPPRRFSLKPLRLCITALATFGLTALWLAGTRPAPTASARSEAAQTYRSFDGPQVHPLALTPDGTRLLAVNSPNATLSVFQLTSGSPVLTAEIPVGLEPVSVAARNDREAWVVNWLSDSVSVVDLTTGNVTRTFDVGDEPTDVLFAGSGGERVFVCVAGGAGLTATSSSTALLGRGQVKIYDASNPAAAPQVLTIFGKQPRALARDAAGARVFVSVFESGNQTTVVPEAAVTAGGGLPAPNPPMSAGLPPAPRTGLIVRWDGSAWVDETGRSWNSALPYRLADVDVVEIDASKSPAAVSADVRGVGTHNGNMVFDPAANRLAVVNLESTNAVRFEPNLRGRFQSNRVTFLSAPPGAAPSVLSTADLNPHVDFNNPAGTEAVRAQSLAFPSDIERASDGTLYVAATSSARVGVLDPGGAVVARVGVGSGPTGLALDETRQRLYVLNRFDNTVGVVDTAARKQVSAVPLGHDPEPADVRAGRKVLNDAGLSAHGTVSCASCHPGGHRDGLAWDLGNPQGEVDTAQGFGLHPLKGPMVTQTLRGIAENTPLHWRGDKPALANFNPLFVSLLGGTRQPTAQESADFDAFIRSLTFPPNPNLTTGGIGRVDVGQRSGFGFFSNQLLFAGNADGSGRMNCADCHLVTGFRSGTNNLLVSKGSIKEAQDFKVPQLRGLYQKWGFNRAGTTAGGELTGFGFTHDGTLDTPFNFLKDSRFDFRNAGDPGTADGWRNAITTLLLTLDTGTAPTVGVMLTVNADDKANAALASSLSLLSQRAGAGDCDLVVRGLYGGRPRGFLRLADGTYQPDSLSEQPVTQQELFSSIGPGAELTFMGVPPGEGRRRALDRDGDGVLEDDGPRTSVQIAGRVVGADGAGLAGVTVTLTGTQTAAAVTDATGRYVFNYVSTAGTHTVAPAAVGFTPQSRTFPKPSWNRSADFVAGAANAADSSRFFVAQHYADFLNREPDAEGLAFWTNEIEACGADQQCREVKRVNVSAAFFLSIEFQETGYLVYKTYKAAFGNLQDRPVPVGFAQLMTDAQRLGRGAVVGSANWQARLEANKQAYFAGLVQRPEFLARYPASMGGAEFAAALDRNAGGVLTRDELGTLAGLGRASAVRFVAENAELSRREFNRAFVLMQYHGYMRRDPNDPPDADFAGYNFWLGKLNDFGGDYVAAEMVKAFITSVEYRRRFGQQ